MSVVAEYFSAETARLRLYLMANPFAQKAVISAGLHTLIIAALLLGSLVSCGVRARRDLSPFDLQSLGQPGKAGGGAVAVAVPAPVVKPEDGLEVIKKKPPAQQPKPKPIPLQPKPTPAPKYTQNDIKKLLGEAVKDVGSGAAPLGHYGAGSGGGVYDPLGWYYAMVRAAMYEAWQQPSALGGQKGLVTSALIKVKRDGLIVTRELVRSSGNQLMDRSVLDAMESVKQLQALPPGFGGDYKEITIDFALTETPLGE